MSNLELKYRHPSATTIQLLPTELRLDPIRADALILLQTTDQILHLEFQTLPTSVPSGMHTEIHTIK